VQRPLIPINRLVKEATSTRIPKYLFFEKNN